MLCVPDHDHSPIIVESLYKSHSNYVQVPVLARQFQIEINPWATTIVTDEANDIQTSNDIAANTVSTKSA